MSATVLGDFETIKLEKEDGIAILTLHRPEKMNAYTPQMMADIIAGMDITDKDDDVKVVIITGSGDRAFCAGADLSQGAKTFDYDNRDDQPAATQDDEGRRDTGGLVSLRFFESLKPIIGAINGAAVGIGVTMQLSMDIRIASDKARFGFVFNRRGINPEAASSWFLPRLVGISKALEWSFTGRIFPASEALAGGLVSEVVPHDDLMARARELAREIADNTAPVSNALTRHMMWRMLGAGHPMEAHILDSAGVYERGQSPDAKEGVMSFLEKRQAVFPAKVSDGMPSFFPWWDEPGFRWISKK